jgi:hypothetical protein
MMHPFITELESMSSEWVRVNVNDNKPQALPDRQDNSPRRDAPRKKD